MPPPHARPRRTEARIAGCITSSIVTMAPRPARAAFCLATYCRAAAAVTRSCTPQKTTVAATTVNTTTRLAVNTPQYTSGLTLSRSGRGDCYAVRQHTGEQWERG